jgi:apolipoprotein N-acyltransferase
MRPQWNVRTLMMPAAILGIGLTALSRPSAAWASLLFTLAVALPLASILKALACRSGERLPWIGFALFGLGFLSITFNLGNSVLCPGGGNPVPESFATQVLVGVSQHINP